MVKLKSEEDLKLLRVSGSILFRVLQRLKEESKKGVKLSDLETLARELLKAESAVPAFLGYRSNKNQRPYPAAICTSVNEEIVHGLPRAYALQDGDLLKIDIGVSHRGYVTDGAATVAIGEVSAVAQKLMAATETALEEAIRACRTGNRLGDIGWIIEKTVKNYNFSVVKNLTGHGIGFALHEEPTVLNYGRPNTGIPLEIGMVLAIEPMVAAGSPETVEDSDHSFRTKDGSLAAHFEHTVAVTERGPEVLT